MKRKLVFVAASMLTAVLLLMLVPHHKAKAQEERGRPTSEDKLSTYLSQSAVIGRWLSHPEQAPDALRSRFRAASLAASQARAARPNLLAQGTAATRRSALSLAGLTNLFNLDVVGLPQNEESITGCKPDLSRVLGGTNDYRGLIDPDGNFTGWYFSTDGGATVENEGLLPTVQIGGKLIPSQGDPVVVADGKCRFFAGGLAFDISDTNMQPNGVGVYRSDPETLAKCTGGSDPACWPTRKAVAVGGTDHFLDKPWLDVGNSGSAGEVVWVAYTDFFEAPGPDIAGIKAVRCDANLNNCTSPILISDDTLHVVQFADVTIGPDHRTYITWTELRFESNGDQTFVHKLRIAPAGSTTFGPIKEVATEPLAIPFGGFLHANDFRVVTIPKNTVTLVGSHPRIFVVWEGCQARPLGTICEEPQIKLTYSNNDGDTWSDPKVLSVRNDNYFPTISKDSAGRLAVAWYTNRFDPKFHNRQDVELVTLAANTVQVVNRKRITPVSNETESDPLLGGLFIGDYFEVFAHDGLALVHYNANPRQIELLFQGFPVNQQDNFLVRTRLDE